MKRLIECEWVILVRPVLSASGAVLAHVGEVGKVVAIGDTDDQLVEFNHDVGGWAGERNRRWLNPSSFEPKK